VPLELAESFDCVSGSEQEFVKGAILRGLGDLLKSDVFRVCRGHALGLQQEIAHVLRLPFYHRSDGVGDGFAPPNTIRPASISNNTTPNAQMSARLSTGLPRACSGDMYAAVPRIAPA